MEEEIAKRFAALDKRIAALEAECDALTRFSGALIGTHPDPQRLLGAVDSLVKGFPPAEKFPGGAEARNRALARLEKLCKSIQAAVQAREAALEEQEDEVPTPTRPRDRSPGR